MEFPYRNYRIVVTKEHAFRIEDGMFLVLPGKYSTAIYVVDTLAKAKAQVDELIGEGAE